MSNEKTELEKRQIPATPDVMIEALHDNITPETESKRVDRDRIRKENKND